MTTTKASPSSIQKSFNVAIVGGGITGATTAQTLLKSSINNSDSDCTYNNNMMINVHLYDQGQRGVGGRASHRRVESPPMDTITTMGSEKEQQPAKKLPMRWDHGCQFFRADTEKMQNLVQKWMEEDIVKKWEGKFMSSPAAAADAISPSPSPSSSTRTRRDFFGMPSMPPFYVGVDGMQSVPKGILDLAQKNSLERNDNESGGSISTLRVFTGTRVAQLEQNKKSKKWKLFGTSGTAAYHDTPESAIQKLKRKNGNQLPPVSCSDAVPETCEVEAEAEAGLEYDAVILTDVSSSFGAWHRASAGIPPQFAERVKSRVGARVPLLTAMIAFDTSSGITGIPFDASTFDHDVLWFASKNNSKPGINGNGTVNDDTNNTNGNGNIECWTLVSTPEYAMAKIEETPMQDPTTGSFIPQSPDYLTTVPGPDLLKAFQEELSNNYSDSIGDQFPNVVYMNAQRWGSAMPCHRQLRESSETRTVISGVPYDSGRQPLAPTQLEIDANINMEESSSFLHDEELMLYQAGDMMSSYTPGFESAALSGIDAAESLIRKLKRIEGMDA
eukprot:CAMPEP_0194108772 /NCGR_PEP_ID=MMETSP0150-20130528/8410_1 /TAXON_ID=122233 /ORGANISM="Chaetoceros debilis, Strain MM31A-1" /LENGTH=557 /DNA_ID=CAMNT_0038797557 /DNA_START=33 /DNA_END=1706 /DNA_ORIENTATION=-